MKFYRTFTIGALFTVFALPRLAPAQNFEGKITQRQITVSEYALYELLGSDEGGDAAELTAEAVFQIPLERVLAMADRMGSGDVDVEELEFYVVADRMRIESGSAVMPGYMLMDFESGAFQMVIPFQEMYLEITKEDVEELRERYGDEESGNEEKEKAQVRPLGMSGEINGMASEAFEVVQGESRAEVWVSADLQDVVNAFAGFVERMEIFGLEDDESDDADIFVLIKEHGFPVLEKKLDISDFATRYEVMEVISVERMTPSADLFVIPEGYERRSFMEMMGG